jgi:L,D-transpeptidase YcbB
VACSTEHCPEYFTKGNYVIRDRDGEVINAEEINWETQSDETYKFVQRAGIGNALGKIKFNLPDTNNIYLHSTGSPKLFAKAYRALSHGCIRVEKARELAHFVMNGMEGWDVARIDRLYDSSQSKIISVDPVEVYLVYWTSWVDSGTKQPYFYADVYGRDKKRVAEILEAMKNPEEASVAKDGE